MQSAEYIYGFHAIEAFLRTTPERAYCLFYNDRASERLQSLLRLAHQYEVLTKTLQPNEFNRFVLTQQHQGVILQIKKEALPSMNEAQLLQRLQTSFQPPFLLILDQIQDPHNFGACLRSANAAGVDAVIITRDRSVGITSVVRKIAVGAVETTPIVTVTNLVSCIKKLQQAGVWIYGLTGEAKQSLYESDFTGPIALVLGAEGKGLRRLTKEHCDHLLSIPMQGSVKSLNVSVAAGVGLFEIVRQRRKLN